ncbi:ATP-binding cassette domain-containing protein [Paenibacillus taichungensis]|uniref:ATP-binding cassette domain-containing protein n=1 Tax=Paenibacillus taichungensis TaxID=484184 RepID=UPI002872178E|nr:ATP-binding cassette domain-containing protein [Paenibacillus taichungensis]MDR9746247.1 ATP-binding cassette domain-containing protein [Paenibacillus taichungensis]
MTMEALLTLKEVSKKYGNRDVLTKVSLTINKGDCIILRGNNGSGKSTMLRIVSGLIPISSGERILKRSNLVIGYTPDRLSKLRMTSTEYLTHMGKISGIPGNNLKNPISELHDFFSLEQSITLKMTHFSKGMLQKNEPNASND